MPDLSAIEFLLTQIPSEDGWNKFLDELDNMTAQEVEFYASAIETLLTTWPEHLRRPLLAWLDTNDLLRLSFCRVYPFWPSIYFPAMCAKGMGKVRGRIFQPNYAAIDSGGHGHRADPDLTGFSFRHATMRPGENGSELLVLASFSPKFSTLGLVDLLLVLTIDLDDGQLRRAFAYWASKPFQRTSCLLLQPLADDFVVLVTAPEDDEKVGAADLFVLWKDEPIFEHHWEGRSIRLPEIPQRNRASIFLPSEDGGIIWGYHFSGEVVRFDIQALDLKESKIDCGDVNDVVSIGDGLLLFTEEGRYLFLDASFQISELEERHLVLGHGEVVAKVSGQLTGKSVAEILAGDVRVQHFIQRCQWNKATHTFVPITSFTVEYRRADRFAPHLNFQVKRIAGHCLCAWIDPNGGKTMHVHDLVTGKSAEMQWRSSPEEAKGFSFDATGKHIIFWEYGSLCRWRLPLI